MSQRETYPKSLSLTPPVITILNGPMMYFIYFGSDPLRQDRQNYWLSININVSHYSCRIR